MARAAQPLVLSLVVLLVFSSISSARTWVIRPDGTGDAPTIQAGLTAASFGDTVLVLSGTYYERDVSLKSGVCLISETGLADCVTIDAQHLSRVIYAVNLDASTSLVGFTLTRGRLNDGFSGGGMRCYQASLQVTNCAFVSNNVGYGYAGGVYLQSSSPVFTNCVFDHNGGIGLSWSGGAVYALRSSPTFIDCVFRYNYRSDGYGGAFASTLGGAPTFDGCLFDHNTADFGGALSLEVEDCDSAAVLITHCTFYANWSTEDPMGATIYSCLPNSFTLDNVIIAFSTSGCAIRNSGSGLPILTCCDIYSNHGGDWIGSIADQYGVNGNVSVDPLFCDAAGGDFQLLPGSPCLDTDSCGTYGAFGVCAQAGVPDEGPVVKEFKLYPSAPNPFSGITTIRYDLPVATEVDLVIYDARGRVVRRLAEARLEQPGQHFECWDGRNGSAVSVAPGVYFCELKAGSFRQTQRLLLLR